MKTHQSNPNDVRYAFFGTPYVARDTLAYLWEKGFRPSVVVTTPDAPQGRGLSLTPCETKLWAEEHHIPILTPEKLTEEARAQIAAYECAYAVVVAYGKILPREAIALFPLGVLNVHYSLLPKYRGASPVESALLCGEETTGVTIQRMVYELDAGDVLAVRETPIGPQETTRELRPRLVTLGAELLAETLPAFITGEAAFIPQNHALATKCGKIEKEDGLLMLTPERALENWRRYRAYAESPGTYFFAQRGNARVRVKILTAHFTDGVFMPLRIVPEGKKETDYKTLIQSGAVPCTF